VLDVLQAERDVVFVEKVRSTLQLTNVQDFELRPGRVAQGRSFPGDPLVSFVPAEPQAVIAS